MNSKLRTDRWLRQQYSYYNRKYFGGALPTIIVKFASASRFPEQGILGSATSNGAYYRIMGGKKPTRQWHNSPAAILIHCKLRKASNLALTTLLHEMVHIALWKHRLLDHHGRAFNREMRRLAAAGAFDGIW